MNLTFLSFGVGEHNSDATDIGPSIARPKLRDQNCAPIDGLSLEDVVHVLAEMAKKRVERGNRNVG